MSLKDDYKKMTEMGKDQEKEQASLEEQKKGASAPQEDIIDLTNEEKKQQERQQVPQPKLASDLGRFVLMLFVAILIGFVSSYIPALWLLAMLFFPLPFAVLVLRYKLFAGFFGLIITFIILSFLVGMPSALSVVLQSGFLGIFYGLCFARKFRPFYVLVGGTLIAAAGTAASIIIATIIAGFPISSLMDSFYQAINIYFDALSKSPYYQQALPDGISIADYRDSFIAFVQRVLPAAFVISSMVIAMLNYLILKKILFSVGYRMPSLPSFSLWRLDWRFTWGVIIGLAFWFIGRNSDIGLLDMIGVNILYILVPVLFTCGLSFLVWLLKYWQASGIIKIIIIVILINFFQYTLFLLIFIGLFDPLFDFRKKLSPK